MYARDTSAKWRGILLRRFKQRASFEAGPAFSVLVLDGACALPESLLVELPGQSKGLRVWGLSRI